MNNIENIRQEIERLKGYISVPHFAEELDSLSEEKPSEDLEEAAEKYSDKYCSDWAYRLEYADAFIAGAEWQAKQLLKDSTLTEKIM